MDVRAILIAGAPPSADEENFAGYSLALLEVLGASAIARLAERIRHFGIDSVSIVAARSSAPPQLRRKQVPARWCEVEDGDVWRASEQEFSELAHQGAELVVVQRVGPYMELEYERLLQFHLDRNARVTQVVEQGSGMPLPAFILSASRRNDAAFLFRRQLRCCRSEAAGFPFDGYSNPLRSAADLRQLARDGLLGQCALKPIGVEIRPGVWAGAGARIERRTRLVAPCYLGELAVARTASVITRASALERGAEADCGSIIEDATLLQFCKLGMGLDCSHSVAGYQRMASLPRRAEVGIADPRLLAMNSASSARNLALQVADLVSAAARDLFRARRKAARGLSPPGNIPIAERSHAARAAMAEECEQHAAVVRYQKSDAVLDSR